MKLTFLKKLRDQSSGFTMIELLVVIAVIGVLSVAVLSSINPIEQINKGRDTRSRSNAAQLINASDRYFSIHELYPWNEAVVDGEIGGTTVDYTPADTDYASEFTFDESEATDLDDWAWVYPLAETQEVKANFLTRVADLSDNVDYYMYKPEGRNENLYVCFFPSSNAFDYEASNRCDPSSATYDGYLAGSITEACADHDTDGSACYSQVGDDDVCMICLP